MDVNLKQTKQALFDSGRTVTGWARANQLNPGTVTNFFAGNFQTDGPVYEAIIAALEHDGLLSVPEKSAA